MSAPHSRKSGSLRRKSTSESKDIVSFETISQVDSDKLFTQVDKRISEKTSRVHKKWKSHEEKTSKRIEDLSKSVEALSGRDPAELVTMATLRRQLEEKEKELSQLQEQIASTKIHNQETASKLAASSETPKGVDQIIEEVKKKYVDDLADLKNRIEQNRKDYQDGLSNLNTQIEEVKKTITNAVQSSTPGGSRLPLRSAQSLGEASKSEEDRKIAMDHRQLAIFKIPPEEANHRIRVIREILDTEVSYVKGLDTLCYTFQPPLRELAKNDKKVKMEDIEHLFGNIDELVQFQQLFLSELKNKMKDYDPETGTIGDFFVKYASYMKSRYASYCSNYECAAALLVQLQTINHFSVAEKKIQEENQLPLSLKDYLITPVQRVPRYSLLLDDLLKHTSEGHPDRELLANAVQKIKEVATNVNLEISQSDALKAAERLESLYEQLQGDYDIWKLLGTQILGTSSAGAKKRHLLHEAGLEVALWKGPKDTYNSVRKSDNTRAYILTDLFITEALITGTGKKWRLEDVNQFAIPLELTWVSSDVRDKLDKKQKAQLGESIDASFEIYGPELSLIVVAANVPEKEAWIAQIKSRVQTRLTEVNGLTTRHNLRSASYTYQIGGEYKGTWKEARPHGEGSYSVNGKSMLLLNGHWDRFLGAGVGSIMQAGAGETYSGWVVNLPDAHPEPVSTETEEELVGEDLAEQILPRDSRDWKVMLTGSETVRFKPGDYVIKQGEVNRILWRIDRGVCGVQKEMESEKKELGEIGEGKLFGEMSLLTTSGGKKATASIVAKTDVVLTKISYDFIYQLFETTPGLAKRFYRVCAIRLSQQLQAMGKGRTTPSKPKRKKVTRRATKSSVGSSGSQSNKGRPEDQEFCQLFGLKGDEVVVKQYSATASSGIVKKSGDFYISQHYFCFYAKVFGSKTREILFIPSVDKLKRAKKSIRIQEQNKKLVMTFPNEKTAEEAFTTMNSLWSQQMSGSGAHKVERTASFVEDEEILSKADWELVLGGAETVSYKEGDVVIEEGKRYERLFQVDKGDLKVVVRGQEVAQMSSGTMFGEIGFLEKTPATASIIAATPCEILEIDNSYFNTLFVKHPAIAAKFFHFLATLLTGRISEREEALLKEDQGKTEGSE